MSADLRTPDGALYACAAYVEPLNAFSFEDATFTILIVPANFDRRTPVETEGPTETIALIRSIALPLANPRSVLVWGLGNIEMGLLMGVIMPGRNRGNYWGMVTEADMDPTGRFRFRSNISPPLLEELKKGFQLQITHVDRDGPVAYSLRGSAAALSALEDCGTRLEQTLAPGPGKPASKYSRLAPTGPASSSPHPKQHPE